MSLTQYLKSCAGRFLHAVSPALEAQLRRRFSRSRDRDWGYRTQLVESCPDNAFIPRVPNAGEVVDGFQVMHNGLKVVCGSYYGEGPVSMLRRNRGVHEPQEERVFQEVLKVIPPESVIIELGAYWAFYSMWFCKEVAHSHAFLVEPVAENLAYGEKNFAANSLHGHFTQAVVGRTPAVTDDGMAVISVDDFVARHRLSHVAIVHCDIQGAEVEMLEGCRNTIQEGRVSWFFISTHSDALHADCETFLRDSRFVIVTSVPPSQSYAIDGILVARASSVPGIPPLVISRRNAR